MSATLAECAEPSVFGNIESALALNSLGDYAGGVFCYLRKVVKVVETQYLDSGHKRTVSRLEIFVAPNARGAYCRTVVSIPKRHNLRAMRVTFGKFDSPVGSLAATVDKIYLIERRRQKVGHFFCQHHLRILDIFAVDHQVHIFFRLLFYGFHHLGMAVTHVCHRNSRNGVDILFAVGTVEIHALGFYYFYI